MSLAYFTEIKLQGIWKENRLQMLANRLDRKVFVSILKGMFTISVSSVEVSVHYLGKSTRY